MQLQILSLLLQFDNNSKLRKLFCKRKQASEKFQQKLFQRKKKKRKREY